MEIQANKKDNDHDMIANIELNSNIHSVLRCKYRLNLSLVLLQNLSTIEMGSPKHIAHYRKKKTCF